MEGRVLQQRSNWRTPKPGVAVDNVVPVKDENLPPMRWPLARVMQLIPGRDGNARVAELRTASGVIRRAVNKLCLLPLEDSVGSQAYVKLGHCVFRLSVPPIATS